MRNCPDWLLAACLLAVAALAQAQDAPAAPAAGPALTWASDPVLPDETVVLLGGRFGGEAAVEVARLGDGDAGTPGRLSELPAERWQALRPVQASDSSLKVVLPRDWQGGAYACRVRTDGRTTRAVVLNAPDPWWMQGDGGESASPGGWLRVFGKCLSFRGYAGLSTAPESLALLRGADGKGQGLQAKEASCYALWFDLPAALAPGDYTVLVHNGYGGPATWREVGALSVKPPEAWPTQVLNVAELGLEGALKAAQEQGGGVVYLPRGRYEVKGALTLPPLTTLRGEGMGLVSLFWPDLDQPPDSLISGSKFRLEDLSIYCQNHRHVVQDAPGSDGMKIRRVRIRADCLFMALGPGETFRGRTAIASIRQTGAAIRVVGRNFEISDCDIYGSNQGISIDPHHFTGPGGAPRCGVIARNRICYGGQGYMLENLDGLIFEGNEVMGADLASGGNGINTFWNNYCQNLYFARNRVHDIYGADREMMTLDAAGGAYFGKVARVDGTQMTLAGDPEYRTYEPKPHTDWTGAAVLILHGLGAGQCRRVVRNEGREWQIDRPWDLTPDDTSLISITPFRGRYLFVGNEFTDGGAVQLYAMSIDCVVAENTGTRMDGFYAWGRNPHGWGWQPSWFCQFLDNRITEGNGYGYRAASLSTFTSDNDEQYGGPLARCGIHRRNVLENNARIRVRGTTEDAVVEHCIVRNNDQGIEVQSTTEGVLLRDNTFEKVATPYAGDGLEKTCVLPSPG